MVQLLEGLSDLTLGLEVCEHALDRRPGLAACHFLANYLTLHFHSQVSPARRRHIHDLHLGSKVLLTLPPGARQDYFPLLSEPLLMLEQLLMNLKVPPNYCCYCCYCCYCIVNKNIKRNM
uniref:Uncharacterized protein n=1 Tax=Hucho hucho TaxID=62062 RepID=A0A4W5JE58_9TELE